jgi:hypothetical protein
MERTTPPWSTRQQRHLSFLAEFTSTPPVFKQSVAAVFIKEPAIALLLRSALHANQPVDKPLPPTVNGEPTVQGNNAFRRRTAIQLHRRCRCPGQLPQCGLHANFPLFADCLMPGRGCGATRRHLYRDIPPASTGGIPHRRHTVVTRDTPPRVVMATLAKRKRTKASIMVFSSISKRSEHLRQ